MTNRTTPDPAPGIQGIALALGSAAAFGASGPFAKSLMDSGWSPGATALVRIGGGAAVLLVPAVLALRRRRGALSGNARLVATYGVVAVAGAQVCFFNAVQHLAVGVALLLEYLAPVLLVGLAWLRTARAPGRSTLAGTVLAVLGLVLVLDITAADGVDAVGVAWGLGAALCLSGYFLMSARIDDGLPPLVLAGGGLVVGAATIAVLGVLGVLPLEVSDSAVVLMGSRTGWVVPAAVLVVVSTVVAYTVGIVAAGRLGSRVASFVGLAEVMFAVLAAWLLLGELPGLVQLAGGVCIVGGIALVHAERRREAPRAVRPSASVQEPTAPGDSW